MLCPPVFAATSESNDYIFKIKMNYFQDPNQTNTYKPFVPEFHPTPSQTPATPTPTPAPQLNSIETGYGDEHEATPYAFRISDILIDYGPLIPTNPVVRSNILSLFSSIAMPYEIFVTENHQLSTGNGLVIPNTTCDNGKCTQEHGNPWQNTLTYGFGYRCDNDDCVSNFSDTSFKQFADESIHQEPVAVMKGILHTNTSGRITYKINIAGTQEKGLYKNTITYLAIPVF